MSLPKQIQPLNYYQTDLQNTEPVRTACKPTFTSSKKPLSTRHKQTTRQLHGIGLQNNKAKNASLKPKLLKYMSSTHHHSHKFLD